MGNNDERDYDNWEYERPVIIGKVEFARKMGFTRAGYYFKKYVHGNRRLMAELHKAGYKKNAKLLTAKMSDIIQEHNGRFYKDNDKK